MSAVEDISQSSRWARFTVGLPLRLALSMVAGVWLAGCVWSFREQTDLAAWAGFDVPVLLPGVLDGLAVGMAAVAWSAALDGRTAAAARGGTGLAVLASAASNATWAWLRSDASPVPVLLGAVIPLAANLAFEVLLGEHRRLVERRRGSQVHPPLPTLHPSRWRYAPLRAFLEQRRMVLELTAPAATMTSATPTSDQTSATEGPRIEPLAAGSGAPELSRRESTTKTARLRALVAAEVTPGDPRSVSALARKYGPQVGLAEATARKTIADLRHNEWADEPAPVTPVLRVATSESGR
ncbi:MAG: DUF2637 domain-containing protein [Streptosporangiales bacterium]